ncbi:Uncharacterised protein [Salmonella enterica subsp. enterica serovar Bovismorbificans]|uniref:Uncharacterized protein n=1 Tax=Salmonella enterica subsp. enterica serovar Bovismorbificans TaxID=58097 RepID=A0A655CY15_SALET|nr:Uncharacterised protein [Salmonella enterica subsp. enterica serovar Bovismorbificans]CNU68540.1 Uncharacterised protein [Salmonella enterica subsp. enterica serovar Bovismorbificans]
MQHRADTFQRQAHFGIKLLGIAGRKIIRMRVDFTRKSGHRQREHIFTVGLRQATNSEFVATRQRFANFFVALAGEFQAELIEFHFTIPQRI